MSLDSITSEVHGAVPKCPYDAAEKWVNRAWGDIRQRNLWSFQLFEGQWISPPLINTGTVATIQGTNVVTLDATATAFLQATVGTQPYSLITTRQFRVGQSGVYNIWGWDGASQLILDRGFGEGTFAVANYQIYQCYYCPSRNAGAAPEPFGDLRYWISVRNMTTFSDLYTNRYNRAMVDAIDPIRMNTLWPSDVIPYQPDQNPQSSTVGNLLFELWGAPLSNYAFQLFGVRNGADLSDDNPNLPIAIREETVIARAKYYAYEWAEANKDLQPRNVGPDFKFLMGATQKDYTELVRQDRMKDRQIVDNWFSIRRTVLPAMTGPVYNSLSGVAYPGAAIGTGS